MHPGVDLRCFWEVYERWLRVIGFVFGRWESQQLELEVPKFGLYGPWG